MAWQGQLYNYNDPIWDDRDRYNTTMIQYGMAGTDILIQYGMIGTYIIMIHYGMIWADIILQ